MTRNELGKIALTAALVAVGVPLANESIVPAIKPILRPTSSPTVPQPQKPEVQAPKTFAPIPILTFTPPQLRSPRPTPSPEKTYLDVLAATWKSFIDQEQTLRHDKEGKVINIALQKGEELDVQRGAGLQMTTDNKGLIQVLFATTDRSQKVYMVIEKDTPADGPETELEKQIPVDHAEPLKAGTIISLEVKQFQLPTVTGSTPDTLPTFRIRKILPPPKPSSKPD